MTINDLASIRDFYSRLLPWPSPGQHGFINLHWTMPPRPQGGEEFKGMTGVPVRQLDDFMALWQAKSHQVDWVKEIYHCMSLQGATRESHGRIRAAKTKEQALAVKSLWLDIDFKEYDEPTALRSVLDFCNDTGFPLPTAIVHSGGGIHVYWISDRVLTPEEWAPYAEGLWYNIQAKGIKADPVTTDIARVLRVPGTWNKKQDIPRPVRLIYLAPKDINFETELAKFKSLAPGKSTPTPRLVLCEPTQDPVWDFLDKPDPKALGEVFEKVPLDYAPMVIECPFLAEALKTGGRWHKEPLWMRTGSICTFVEGGRELFHLMSKGHPDYDEAKTDDKFDQREEADIGYPTCGDIERNGSKQCAGCKHKGKISSPLKLAAPIRPPDPLAVAGVAEGTAAPADLFLPQDYVLNPEGRISCAVDKQISANQTVRVLEPLFLCKVRNPWLEVDKAIHFDCSTENQRWKHVAVPYAVLGTAFNLTTTLSKLNVLYNPKHGERLRQFMFSWQEKLRNDIKASSAAGLGWWNEDGITGWAYNSKVHCNDGTVRNAGLLESPLRENYTPIGEIGPWFEALKLVTDQHRPELEAIVAASFAAPLIKFSNSLASILSAFSQSGSNKTTAVQIGLAVWGHPIKTKQTNTSSKKGILKRIGDLRHLPCYWDDIQDGETLVQAALMLSEATEGSSGTKLRSDQSYVPEHSWQTAIIMCANFSLFDEVVKKTKNNIARVSRVFEYQVSSPADRTDIPGRRLQSEITPIMRKLWDNYGNMGQRYSIFLGNKPEAVEELFDRETAIFEGDVKPQQAEQYWLTTCTALLVGARIGNLLGASFNTEELRRFLVETFIENRNKVHREDLVGGTMENTATALAGFIKANTGHILHVKKRSTGGATADVYNNPDLRQTAPIHIQFAVEERSCAISKQAFYTWLQENGQSVSMVMDGLRKHFDIKGHGKSKTFPAIDLTAGTPWNGMSEPCILLPVPPGSILEGPMLSVAPQLVKIAPAPVTHSGLLTGFPDAGKTGPSPLG